MSRYHDLDAAVAELEDIEFKIRGHRYSIGPDPDATVILKHLAAGTINDPSVAGELLESLLGADVWTQIQTNGIGTRQLALLTETLMAELGFSELGSTIAGAALNGDAGDEGEGDEGKA